VASHTQGGNLKVSLKQVKGTTYLDYSGVHARSTTLISYAACLAVIAVTLTTVVGYGLMVIRSVPHPSLSRRHVHNRTRHCPSTSTNISTSARTGKFTTSHSGRLWVNGH
jgi:hypothetical protein